MNFLNHYNMSELETLKELDPVVASVLIVCITAVICTFIWQLYKTIRES